MCWFLEICPIKRNRLYLMYKWKYRASVQERCEKLLWNQVDEDWDKQKEKILGALGPDQNLSDIAIERQKVTIGPMTMAGRTSLDSFEILYAKQLYVYTEAILKGKYSWTMDMNSVPLIAILLY